MSRGDEDRDEPWTESLIVTLPREKVQDVRAETLDSSGKKRNAGMRCSLLSSSPRRRQEFSAGVFLEKEEMKSVKRNGDI